MPRRTTPLSPVEIEIALADNIEALEEAVNLQKALAETYASKEHDYKLTSAKAWLQARTDPSLKSEKLREAWVYTQIGEKRLDRDIAQGQLDAQKNVVRMLTSAGEQLRSLARSSRDMTDGPGWGSRS